jgi:hypothetical protein
MLLRDNGCKVALERGRRNHGSFHDKLERLLVLPFLL